MFNSSEAIIKGLIAKKAGLSSVVMVNIKNFAKIMVSKLQHQIHLEHEQGISSRKNE